MFGKTKSGKEIFKTICKAFDFKGFEYKADETNLQIYSKFQGDDLPIHLLISIDDSSTSIDFRCKLAFEAPMSSYNDILTQLNTINNSLRYGAFLLDPETGWLMYKYGYIFAEAKPSESLILSIVAMVIETVDSHDGELKKIIPINTDLKDPMFR